MPRPTAGTSTVLARSITAAILKTISYTVSDGHIERRSWRPDLRESRQTQRRDPGHHIDGNISAHSTSDPVSRLEGSPTRYQPKREAMSITTLLSEARDRHTAHRAQRAEHEALVRELPPTAPRTSGLELEMLAGRSDDPEAARDPGHPGPPPAAAPGACRRDAPVGLTRPARPRQPVLIDVSEPVTAASREQPHDDAATAFGHSRIRKPTPKSDPPPLPIRRRVVHRPQGRPTRDAPEVVGRGDPRHAGRPDRSGDRLRAGDLRFAQRRRRRPASSRSRRASCPWRSRCPPGSAAGTCRADSACARTAPPARWRAR